MLPLDGVIPFATLRHRRDVCDATRVLAAVEVPTERGVPRPSYHDASEAMSDSRSWLKSTSGVPRSQDSYRTMVARYNRCSILFHVARTRRTSDRPCDHRGARPIGQTFVQGVRSAQDLRTGGAGSRPGCFQVLHNVAVDYLRRTRLDWAIARYAPGRRPSVLPPSDWIDRPPLKPKWNGACS